MKKPAFILIFCLLLAACSKTDGAPSEADTVVDSASSSFDFSDEPLLPEQPAIESVPYEAVTLYRTGIGGYYRGTEEVSLPASAEGYSVYVGAMTIENNIVYALGTYYEGRVRKACYWQGMERTDIPIPEGASDFSIYSIAVAGGIVYVAGSYKKDGVDRACYWQDAEITDLPIPPKASSFSANSITAVNGTVYIAGSYIENGSVRKACYWQDMKIMRLPMPEEVNSFSANFITVVNGAVYVAGSYTEDGVQKGCYWQDAELIELPMPEEALSFGISSITAENGIVYIAGSYSYTEHIYAGYFYKACYWQNTERIDLDLPAGTNQSSAMDIAVVGGTVYVAGYHYVGEESVTACYWENNVRHDAGEFYTTSERLFMEVKS